MHFETFANGSSLVHRLDPRARLLGAVPLAFSIALLQTLPTAFTGLGLGMALILTAGFPLKQVLYRLGTVNLFIALIWLLLPFSVPGDPAFRLGPFSASWQGLNLALLISIKSNAIILLSLALLCSMRIITLVRGLEALHVPNKLCQILFFSLRYFQVIHAEYHRLHDAMLVRGFTPKTNLYTLKTYGYLISMLLVRSLNRGQRVYEAMLCRGYTGAFPSLQEFQLQGGDKLFLLLCWLATILLLGLGRSYFT